MTGLSDLNNVILGGNLVLLITTIVFIQEIKKVEKTKDGKAFLQHESPKEWVKACTKFSVVSLLCSLIYAIVAGQNLVLEQQPLFDYLFYFGILLFLFGVLFTVRIIWFVVDPSSPANIFAGKILAKISKYGLRVTLLALVVSLQIIDGVMLPYPLFDALVRHTVLNLFGIVYLSTLILSFIGFFPLMYELLFHYEEKIRLRGIVSIIFVFSPWFVLVMTNVLIRLGIISF
jgi:hypothetical protein